MTGLIDSNDNYAEKLAKLLPAEGIAALTTIQSLLPLERSNLRWIEFSVAIVGIFVLLWAFRLRKIHDPLQLGLIALAYLLWANTILWAWIHFAFAFAADLPPTIPALLSILYALFIPLFFKEP